MKKNIYFTYTKNFSPSQRAKKIKEAGFDGVFLFYDDMILENIKAVRGVFLEIETIHLPFDLCNNLWTDSDDYYNIIIEGIECAYKNRIPSVIVHTTKGYTPPTCNEIGLEKLKKMVALCEKRKVNLCIENLRSMEHLEYIFSNIESDYLKICFDSGHANAFTKNIECFPFDKYGKYFHALHLHDNLGDRDSHLIPFCGNINWEKLMKKLKEIGYTNPLTLEIVLNNENFDEDEFLKKTKNILDKFEEYRK